MFKVPYSRQAVKITSLELIDDHELGPSIKDVCTLEGRGVSQKWTNADKGRGWFAKCGRPLGKKIIATIFVKFT